MTGSSVLPVTIHKGKLLFLFGKENPKEDSAKGFSDFGGGVEKGEDIYDSALREGGEELTGFLGDETILRKHIEKYKGPYKLSYNDYHIHIFPIEYNERLPEYYNQNHQFLWNRMDQNLLNKTKLFEKIEIQWFSVNMIKKRMREFRSFYQTVLKNTVLKEIKPIRTYIQSRLLSTKSRRKKKNSNRINNRQSKRFRHYSTRRNNSESKISKF